MRACESAYARGGHVQSVWINPGLGTIDGKFRLPIDALHQALGKPQRRSARAVGFLAMKHLVDVRIIAGRMPNPVCRRGDNPKVDIHTERKIRRVEYARFLRLGANLLYTIVPASGSNNDVFSSFERLSDVFDSSLGRGKFDTDVDIAQQCGRRQAVDVENLRYRFSLLPCCRLDLATHFSVAEQCDLH